MGWRRRLFYFGASRIKNLGIRCSRWCNGLHASSGDGRGGWVFDSPGGIAYSLLRICTTNSRILTNCADRLVT